VHITLVELAEMLQREHGARFAPSTVWHFLDGHTMIVKKQRTRVSKGGPTSRLSDAPDSTLGLTSTPSAWSSSTRPAPRPKWLDYAGGPDAVSAAVLRSRTAIGRTITFTGALRLPSLAGPMVLGGPMNRTAFGAYIKQVPVPTLRPATSSSWTACPPKRARARAPPSRPQAPSFATCRPTHWTSNP
jgi:hypothetical protein